MKIKQAVFLFMVFGLLFFVAGCGGNNRESTQTLEVSRLVNGSNIRLLSITSSKYYPQQKQEEIYPKLEAMINGGGYNITSVKTSYSFGYLTSAEVTYDASGRGDGNNLRLLFVQSARYYHQQKAAEIKPKLDAIMNGGQYNIVKIQTIYARRDLLAAEVYHQEK